MNKVVKFSAYIGTDLLCELPKAYSYQQHADEQVFNLLEIEQQRDFIEALRYIESQFLNKDIAGLKKDDWLVYIKRVNELSAQAITLFNDLQSQSGTYSKIRLTVLGETGLFGEEYELPQNWGFSSHNYNILLKKYGKEKAKLYRDFCQKFEHEKNQFINAKTLSDPEKHARNLAFDILDFINSIPILVNHPGLQCYKEIIVFKTHPREIPQAMQNFCERLEERIRQKQDPIKIAAFAHQELTKIHPFPNGNGRTARMLLNSILMQYGYQPVVLRGEELTDEQRSKYNLAVAQGHNDPAIFESYLQEKINYIKNNIAQLNNGYPGFLVRNDGFNSYEAFRSGKFFFEFPFKPGCYYVTDKDNPVIQMPTLLPLLAQNPALEVIKLDVAYCYQEAQSHYQRNNYPHAIYMFVKALDLDRRAAQRSFDVNTIGKIHWYLASCYSEQGCVRQANTHAKQCLEILSNKTMVEYVQAQKIAKATDEILNLAAKQASFTSAFNKEDVLSFINKALGKRFIETYINSGLCNWVISEIDGSYTATLSRLAISSQNDSGWYRAKFIKAGIHGTDIHFDQVKTEKGDRWKIRLTNVQAIPLLAHQEQTSIVKCHK